MTRYDAFLWELKRQSLLAAEHLRCLDSRDHGCVGLAGGTPQACIRHAPDYSRYLFGENYLTTTQPSCEWTCPCLLRSLIMIVPFGSNRRRAEASQSDCSGIAMKTLRSLKTRASLHSKQAKIGSETAGQVDSYFHKIIIDRCRGTWW